MRESVLQQSLRVAAPKNNAILWRNNNGAMFDETGRLVRFGLGHDSAKTNKFIKSSDLIGITEITITPEMVGKKVGVFTAVECKPSDWKFPRPTNKKEFARCNAQKNFIDKVIGMGGMATFATKIEDVFI